MRRRAVAAVSSFMIELRHLSQRFASPSGWVEALHDINLSIAAGQIFGIIGRSGAGKSTLVRTINLLTRPSAGEVVVDGKVLTALAPAALREARRDIGMVFQHFNLLSSRTVFDNVALPLEIAGCTREEIGKRVRAALDKVGLLAREASAPVTLSTGEQQRVGIARAIVGKPPVLIADEPTGNLDPMLSAEIMKLFAEFEQVGTAVLVASHDLNLIKRMGKRVLVLDHGKLIDDFRPATAKAEVPA